MSIFMEFGQLVRKSRQSKHITQETLAELCELSTRHVSSIETGKANPKLDTALKLCAACGINTGELPHADIREVDPRGVPLSLHEAAAIS